VEGSDLKWRPVVREVCTGETSPCQSEEDKPWNGNDVTAVFQEHVYFR
jgi:hypothetical protein